MIRISGLIRWMMLGGGLAAMSVQGAMTGELPLALSLRPQYEAHGLTVQAQGTDLCWAYALAGVLDYEFTVNARQPVRFSPIYLKWARSVMNHSRSNGCHAGQCLRALEQHGICAWDLYPPALEAYGGPVELALANAQVRRGTIEPRWIMLCNHTSGLSDAQFLAIKGSLASGHPVAVGLYWPNKIAFERSVPFLMITPARDGVHMGHFVVLAGYQDNPTYGGGGAFLVRNSFGPQWGDQGYAWMPYAYARQYIYDAVSFRARPRPVDFNPTAVDFTGRILLEAESLRIAAAQNLKATPCDMAPIALQHWSGGRQLFCEAAQAAKVDGSVALEFSIERPGQYWIFAKITRAPNHGQARFAVDGRILEECLDGCGLDVYPANRVLLGKTALPAGRHTMTVTVTGKSSAATGYGYGLDAFELLPER